MIRLRKPTGSLYTQKFIVPKYKSLEYIRRSLDPEVIFNISVGSIRSGKTTENIVAFCMNLELSPDILHMAIGVNASTAKTILFEGDGLGIKHYPEWQERVEIVNGKRVRFPQRIFETKFQDKDALCLLPLKKGDPKKYIIAFGGDTVSSYTAFHGMSFGMVISTEANLLHSNTVIKYMERTVASRWRKIFEDLNPGNPRQWYKTERLDVLLKQTPDEINYIEKRLTDNPFLKEHQINNLKMQYPPNSVQYRNSILGEWVAAEGLIYDFQDDKNIITSFNANDYFSYIISIDPGVNHSATVFSTVGITRDFKYLDTLNEYYHKNSDQYGMGVKMPIDYVMDFIDYLRKTVAEMGRYPQEIVCDNDLTFIREFERVKYREGMGGIYLTTKFDKGLIRDRIKTDVNMLFQGRKRVHIRCVKTIEAYRTAQYDPKESQKGNYVRLDDPVAGTMIDPIDANEYATLRFGYELSRYQMS